MAGSVLPALPHAVLHQHSCAIEARPSPRAPARTTADTQCLADVPEDERCHCKHEPVDGNPNMYEVKPKNADVSNHSVV